MSFRKGKDEKFPQAESVLPLIKTVLIRHQSFSTCVQYLYSIKAFSLVHTAVSPTKEQYTGSAEEAREGTQAGQLTPAGQRDAPYHVLRS